MNKITKILLAVVIILLIFAAITTLAQDQIKKNTNGLDEYTEIIGNNSNGTVYKITCGNESANDTAIMILGVHSLESGIHNATNETIMKLTKENNLSKKFIVYFIKLNFNDSGMNTSDYDTNRHMGELLAYDYIVPDIKNYNPYIVVDAHEMEEYWDTQRYVGLINNDSNTTMGYANEIGDNLSYPVLTITSGTSPEWVTIPISKQGKNVILFETAQADTQKEKTKTAINLVKTIDSLKAN